MTQTTKMTAPATLLDTAAANYREDEDDTLLARGMKRVAREQAERWASYSLPKVPPIAQFDDFAAASRKRHDLAVERTALEKQLRTAVTAIARGFAANRETETERQAQDILDGRPEEAFAGFEELKAQVARLTQRSKAYAAAVRKQDEVVATIRSERSIDAAEIMQTTHKTAVANMVAAVEQLRAAIDQEDAARTLVVRAGYDNRLPSFAMPRLLGDGGPLDDLMRRGQDYVR